MHDPPGDPTFEPPQPLTEPTPNPASDPPPEMPGDPPQLLGNAPTSALQSDNPTVLTAGVLDPEAPGFAGGYLLTISGV
jgi:hypothetical protein